MFDFNNSQKETPRPFLVGAPTEQVAKRMAEVLWKHRATNICLYKVDTTTVVADYYLICTCGSNTHMKSSAEDLMYELELSGIGDARLEGRFGSSWLLIDFGEIIVHIFNHESREFYHLDRMMGEDQKVELTFDEE